MKKFEMAIKTLFTQKERYLLSKQNCFVLNPNYYATEIDSDIDSEAAKGPKKNPNWWNGMKGQIETQLIQGLINELEPKILENPP